MINIYSEDKRYKFEVVEKIPNNYHIWNVNKNLLKGYIPLIKLSSNQGFKGGRNIETETMKAIKCEDYEKIMDNLYIIKNVNNTEDWLKKNESNTKKQWEVNRIKKSLPLIKKINGWENIID